MRWSVCWSDMRIVALFGLLIRFWSVIRFSFSGLYAYSKLASSQKIHTPPPRSVWMQFWDTWVEEPVSRKSLLFRVCVRIGYRFLRWLRLSRWGRSSSRCRPVWIDSVLRVGFWRGWVIWIQFWVRVWWGCRRVGGFIGGGWHSSAVHHWVYWLPHRYFQLWCRYRDLSFSGCSWCGAFCWRKEADA